MFYNKFSVAVLLAMIFISSRSWASTDDTETTHYGKFVSISGETLTMTNKNGKRQSLTLAPKVKLTCDGSTCGADDLKTGMKIRVATRVGDDTVVTHVDGIKDNTRFDDRYEGVVVSLKCKNLVMTHSVGKQFACMAAPEVTMSSDWAGRRLQEQCRNETPCDCGTLSGSNVTEGEAIDMNAKSSEMT
jgi:hypothetical protein